MSASRQDKFNKESADILNNFANLIISLSESKIKLTTAQEAEVKKLFDIFHDIHHKANSKSGIINQFHKQQVDVMTGIVKLKEITLPVDAALVEALRLIADFTHKKPVSAKKLGEIQDKLVQSYKDIMPALKTFQQLALPHLEGSLNHAMELAEKVGGAKQALASSKTALNKIPMYQDYFQSAASFSSFLATSIESELLYLNKENEPLKKTYASAIEHTETLKTEIKKILDPVVKIKAEIERQAQSNASGYSAPLPSSHGAKSESSIQKALQEAKSQTSIPNAPPPPPLLNKPPAPTIPNRPSQSPNIVVEPSSPAPKQLYVRASKPLASRTGASLPSSSYGAQHQAAADRAMDAKNQSGAVHPAPDKSNPKAK